MELGNRSGAECRLASLSRIGSEGVGHTKICRISIVVKYYSLFITFPFQIMTWEEVAASFSLTVLATPFVLQKPVFA